ncbi:hypothetical protein BGZ73_000701 [Actinomortierella ambigua]|nr:hypothetical protein BGZ73_000701 [Actinomortierella ambigua]
MSHRLTQNVDSEEDEDDDEDDGAVAFGYIPLDQDENMPLGSDDDGDGDGDEITAEDHVAGEVDRNIDEEDSDNGEDAGQGYADYLVDRDGEAIVPTIPAGVMIDTMDAQDPIPEDDLQTIQSIMQSFVLPASAVPDWAKAIPEERWLPRIAARALPGEAAEDASQIFSP